MLFQAKVADAVDCIALESVDLGESSVAVLLTTITLNAQVIQTSKIVAGVQLADYAVDRASHVKTEYVYTGEPIGGMAVQQRGTATNTFRC